MDQIVLFEQLYREYATGIQRMCYLYLGDCQMAEDAMQETFVKVFRNYDKFHEKKQYKDMDYKVNMLEADLNVEVPSYDNQTGSVTVTHIEVDGINLYVEGMTSDTFDFMKFGYGKPNTPICVMKDGTNITMKTNGMGGNDLTHYANFDYVFPTIVNLKNLEKIEWHGVTIWSAK